MYEHSLREAFIESALIDLILATDSGDWDNVDLARSKAVAILGFDPLED
jgi:hypothetical protein